tara:strand:- start:2360 stop:3670 length:1311 start_codon:yes stop_codon:yes gene_type:complete
MKNLRLLLILILSINFVHGSYIQYSGVSYISQNKDIKSIFPNSIKLESSLRGLIYEHLSNNKSLNSDLQLGVSETFRDGSYSIIVALDNESISSIYLNRIGNDDKCQRTFSLSTQTIVFNTKEQQIVSIKPNAARRLHFDDPIDGKCNYRDTKLELLRFAEMFYGVEIQKKDYESYLSKNENEIIEMIKNKSVDAYSYLGDKSVLTNVINEILSADLNALSNTNFFVGVDDVMLSKFVSDQMSGKKDISENYYFTDPLFGDFQHQSYKVWVGQEFSKWFSDTFNYPLIPYVKGKALGNDIPLKFADSDEILNLRLPSLDFGFVIKVKGFKKVKLDESKLREAYAWAAFSSIEFHNVGVKKLTEIDLKNVLTAEVNKGDGIDDWDNFNTSFNRIMKDYVSNINTYDKKWLSKSSKMPAKDFKKHVNLIKKNIRLDND